MNLSLSDEQEFEDFVLDYGTVENRVAQGDEHIGG